MKISIVVGLTALSLTQHIEAFSTVMAPQWIGRGYFWQAAGLTFLVGAINLAANFWLIPLYGMTGAVYAFLGTYTFSIFGNGIMAIHCEMKYRNKYC